MTHYCLLEPIIQHEFKRTVKCWGLVRLYRCYPEEFTTEPPFNLGSVVLDRCPHSGFMRSTSQWSNDLMYSTDCVGALVIQTDVPKGVKKISRFICQGSRRPIVEFERTHLRRTVSRTAGRMWTH